MAGRGGVRRSALTASRDLVAALGRQESKRLTSDPMHQERLLKIRVECYAGHRGEETPRALILGDRRIDVAEVVDAWLAPE